MRVLVVEDEPRIAQDLCSALKTAGMAVDLARDGEEAWFMGDTENYDAVVLDLGLPKMDGFLEHEIQSTDQSVAAFIRTIAAPS